MAVAVQDTVHWRGSELQNAWETDGELSTRPRIPRSQAASRTFHASFANTSTQMSTASVDSACCMVELVAAGGGRRRGWGGL